MQELAPSEITLIGQAGHVEGYGSEAGRVASPWGKRGHKCATWWDLRDAVSSIESAISSAH